MGAKGLRICYGRQNDWRLQHRKLFVLPDTKERVTWRDAATGRILAESDFFEPMTFGSLITPGIGGRVYYATGEGFNVPLESLMRDRSALVHLVMRTGLYGFGVLVVLLLEKAFEARHEYGGFVSSLSQVIRHQDIPHVLTAAIGVTCALLVFNALIVIRRQLGERGLQQIFLSPLREKEKDGQ